MNKKYELTDETIQHEGRNLYRIRALRDIPAHHYFAGEPTRDIKAGDLGGFVESEDNLSHYDGCWIADGAKVYENARVVDYALVRDYASVGGESRVELFAVVSDDARIRGDACVTGLEEIGFHADIRSKDDIVHLRPDANLRRWPKQREFDFAIYRCLHDPMVTMREYIGDVTGFIPFVETAGQFDKGTIRSTILGLVGANQDIIDEWGRGKPTYLRKTV